MEVRARASCRADLAGGTLDIWPLGLLHADARTVNVALDLSVRVRVRNHPSNYTVSQLDETRSVHARSELLDHRDTALIGHVLEALEVPPVEIDIESASPRGAGLGASSALTIALIAACEEIVGGSRRSRHEAAQLARDLEARLMGLPTGCQDHYPALFGGVLDISFRPGRTDINPIGVDLEALSEHLVLAYSGASHVSAENNWHIVRARLDGDPKLRALLDGIAESARGMAESLEMDDFAAAGAILSQEWALRRQLSDVVSIPKIEELLEAARDGGAWGGKACGAGGGGCIVVLAAPECRSAVETALRDCGGQILPARCAPEGLRVTSA